MVDLAAAKHHCRVDFDDEDASIEAMIAAASNHLESVGVDMTEPLPAAIEHAVLMLVGHFYRNREAVAKADEAAIDIGVDRLIQPYREVHL